MMLAGLPVPPDEIQELVGLSSSRGSLVAQDEGLRRAHLLPEREQSGEQTSPTWSARASRELRRTTGPSHFAPTASISRHPPANPWRFKSSDPHSQIRRFRCPISPQTHPK